MSGYKKNASQVIDFVMVTTAGVADAAGVPICNRVLDNSTLTSTTGNIINKGSGAFALVAASADLNGNTVGLFFFASGDVPLCFTFPTDGNPCDLNGNVLGNVTGSVGSVTGNLNGNVLGSVQGNIGGNVAGSVASVTGAVGSVTGAVGSVTGNVGGNVTGSVGSVVGAVGSVTGNVGGNVTGSVGSVLGNVNGNVLGSVQGNIGGSIAIIGVGAIGATSFTTAALNAMADAMLDRNMATGTDSGTETTRTVRQALRFNRNKVDAVTGEVFKEDDTTVSWTFAVTRAAGNPIVQVDPSG